MTADPLPRELATGMVVVSSVVYTEDRDGFPKTSSWRRGDLAAKTSEWRRGGKNIRVASWRQQIGRLGGY
jgi:hypothetical protein